MRSIFYTAIALAIAAPASAQDFDPTTLLGPSFAGAQVIDAASDRTSKIIDPPNSVIGSLEVKQRLESDDVFIKNGIVEANIFDTRNINAGSVYVNQDTRFQNVNVRNGYVSVNGAYLEGSTYGRVRITQDADIRNLTVINGSFIGNQVRGR